MYAWSDLVGDGGDWLVADILVPGTPAAVVVASVAHEARTRSRETNLGPMNAKIHCAASKPLWRGYREVRARCWGPQGDRYRLCAIVSYLEETIVEVLLSWLQFRSVTAGRARRTRAGYIAFVESPGRFVVRGPNAGEEDGTGRFLVEYLAWKEYTRQATLAEQSATGVNVHRR